MDEPEVSVALAGPLHEARFLARPHQFVVRAEFQDGGQVEAHLADPGRLRELLLPGATLWLRRAAAAARKTDWTAVLVAEQEHGALVSLEPTLANRLIHAALLAGAVDELAGYEFERSEYPAGGSRFDFLLRSRFGLRLVLEVKSVTLAEHGTGYFPDAVTARGARHLRELAALAQEPDTEAAVLFAAQRGDVQLFRPAWHIDPAFARALLEAREAGVRLLARSCPLTLERLCLGSPLRVELAPLR